MPLSPHAVDRLNDLVRRRNRELAFDAALRAGLGALFAGLTFGVVFWLAIFVGFLWGRHFGLSPVQFALAFTGVFLVVAIWSAWRRVNPLADIKGLTDREAIAILVGQATQTLTFSPRHASAGAALLLVGGPKAIFEALGVWAHRLKADAATLQEAALILAACRTKLPIEKVANPPAAVLLRRLDLIKVGKIDEAGMLVLTRKGLEVLDVVRGKVAVQGK